MPSNMVKTKAQETKWKRAKAAVERSRKKGESEFTDRDWGLVTSIYKGIKEGIDSFVLSAAFRGISISEANEANTAEVFQQELSGEPEFRGLSDDDWDDIWDFFNKRDALSVIFAPDVFTVFVKFSKEVGFPVTLGGAEKGGLDAPRFDTKALLGALVGSDVLDIVDVPAVDAMDAKHSDKEDKKFKDSPKMRVDVYRYSNEFKRELHGVMVALGLEEVRLQKKESEDNMASKVIDQVYEDLNGIVNLLKEEDEDNPVGQEPEKETTVQDFFKHIDDDTLEKFVDGMLLVLGELEQTGKIPKFQSPEDVQNAVVAAVRRMYSKRSLISQMSRKFHRFGSQRTLRKKRIDIGKAIS